MTRLDEQDWGRTLEGALAKRFTLANSNGMAARITNYGAILTELQVPDQHGKPGNVVLGFDSLESYLKGHPFFGAIAGRVANRIARAEFTLDGQRYPLAANNGPNHLHGGKKGFDKVVWDAESSESPRGPAITLTYVSKHSDEGYPGTVTATVVYTLTHDNELRVDMKANTDATTLVNLAQHTYWNLGGIGSGTILDAELTLHAQKFTPGDPMVPTGAIVAVEGTPFDFRAPEPIVKDLQAAGGNPVGYDANWVVDGDARTMRPVARVRDPKSGRVMTLEADQPGVQFYSGNFLDGSLKGKGVTYEKHAALCLETQVFPNAINIPAWQSDVILKPGQTYKHTMVHRFTTA